MSSERFKIGRLELHSPFLDFTLAPWWETGPSEQEPLTCEQLRKIYLQNGGDQIKGKILKTDGITVRDLDGSEVPAEVLNISGLFQVLVNGETLTVCAFRRDIPGVEGRGDVGIGILENDSLLPIKNGRVFPEEKGDQIKGYEDPKRVQIGNSWVLIMTKVKKEGWQMSFQLDSDLNRLDEYREFASGPEGMKDITLVELQDGRILVFTRPEREIEYLSINGHLDRVTIKQVGWIIIDDLTQLTPETINRAKMIENLFAWGEWGGVNDAILLENGKIGVLGHIAYEDKEHNKHYYPITFEFDPETGLVDNFQIIATKDNFPEAKGVAKIVKGKKETHLVDVVYFNGMDAYELEVERDGKIEKIVMIRYYGGAGDKVPVVLEKESTFSARPVKIIKLPEQRQESKAA